MEIIYNNTLIVESGAVYRITQVQEFSSSRIFPQNICCLLFFMSQTMRVGDLIEASIILLFQNIVFANIMLTKKIRMHFC